MSQQIVEQLLLAIKTGGGAGGNVNIADPTTPAQKLAVSAAGEAQVKDANVGLVADAAWSGTGNGTVVAILKAIWSVLSPTTLVSRLQTSLATTNATNIKAAAGFMKGIQGYNNAAALRWLKIYDKATAPVVGTDVPLKTLVLAATGPFQFNFGQPGIKFANGISYALTQGQADSDTTAVAAADILGLNIDYG